MNVGNACHYQAHPSTGKFSKEFNLFFGYMAGLIRRGVIFGHRDFGLIAGAVARKEPFCVLTGLVPSGGMHLGHKMVIDEAIYFQGVGAEIFITVADLEGKNVCFSISYFVTSGVTPLKEVVGLIIAVPKINCVPSK